MALDHLEKFTKLALFEIIPTGTAFADVDKAYGKRGKHEGANIVYPRRW